LLVGIADGGKRLATVGESGGENVACTHPFTVNDLFFVDHFEGVACTNVHGEVDVVTEYAGKVHGQVVAKACAYCGQEKTAFDFAVCVGSAYFWCDLFFLEDVTVVFGSVDPDALKLADRAV